MWMPWRAPRYYSPLVDISEVRKDARIIWPGEPTFAGIDYRDAAQIELLRGPFAQLMPRFDYLAKLPRGAGKDKFYVDNSQFSYLDCRALFVLLQHLRPKRMIEIGSGYSSLLAADVNMRFLNGGTEITCIEPYPRSFLRQGVHGIGRLIQSRLQEVDLATFGQLEAGDVLFVDSSHVSKTGSDVNRVFFHILPKLKAGVVLHFHDVFLPWDYPQEWVAGEGRSWNEQYLLCAFLSQNPAYEVLFTCHYMSRMHFEEVRPYCDAPGGGSSFWVRKKM